MNIRVSTTPRQKVCSRRLLRYRSNFEIGETILFERKRNDTTLKLFFRKIWYYTSPSPLRQYTNIQSFTKKKLYKKSDTKHGNTISFYFDFVTQYNVYNLNITCIPSEFDEKTTHFTLQ